MYFFLTVIVFVWQLHGSPHHHMFLSFPLSAFQWILVSTSRSVTFPFFYVYFSLFSRSFVTFYVLCFLISDIRLWFLAPPLEELYIFNSNSLTNYGRYLLTPVESLFTKPLNLTSSTWVTKLFSLTHYLPHSLSLSSWFDLHKTIDWLTQAQSSSFQPYLPKYFITAIDPWSC